MFSDQRRAPVFKNVTRPRALNDSCARHVSRPRDSNGRVDLAIRISWVRAIARTVIESIRRMRHCFRRGLESIREAMPPAVFKFVSCLRRSRVRFRSNPRSLAVRLTLSSGFSWVRAIARIALGSIRRMRHHLQRRADAVREAMRGSPPFALGSPPFASAVLRIAANPL